MPFLQPLVTVFQHLLAGYAHSAVWYAAGLQLSEVEEKKVLVAVPVAQWHGF